MVASILVNVLKLLLMADACSVRIFKDVRGIRVSVRTRFDVEH